MANINIRVDDKLKKEAENIFTELGLTLTAATNVFYKQVVRCGGIPFDLRLPDPFYSAENHARLQKSIQEANEGKFVSKTMDDLRSMEK